MTDQSMTDQSAYIIANLVIEDAAVYRAYEKGFFPLLKKHGGEFLTYDDRSEHLEGVSPRPGRLVLLRFVSAEQAKAWFNDPDYQALSEHRRAGTRLEFITLVHAAPARG